MIITPIKTPIIEPGSEDIITVIDKTVTTLNTRSILVITSKIIAICEGSIANLEQSKQKRAKQYADYHTVTKIGNKQHVITITNNVIALNAGIDESNVKGFLVLPPKNPQQTAKKIRSHLKKRFRLGEVGVVITDSISWPFRRGTMGVAFSHAGFIGLKKYVGKKDLVGRIHRSTFSNVRDALAISAVIVMGEGKEQTPMAIIEDIPFVEFRDNAPTREEISALSVNQDNDFYTPLLKKINWKES